MRLTRALTATLLVGAALTSTSASATPANPVDSWSGSLTAHVPGYPAPQETGATVLVGGDVRLAAQTSRLTGSVRVGGALDELRPGRLVVTPGAMTGGVCVGGSSLSTDLGGSEAALGVSVGGDTVSFDVSMPLVQVGQTYDCLDVDLYRRAVDEDKTSNDVVLTDRMTGILTPTMLTSAIEVLPVQKAVVDRGGSTTAWVSVRNTGELPVNELTLSAGGSGAKVVTAASIPTLEAGRTASFRVTVTLARRAAKASVPFTVSGGATTASGTLRVKRAAKASLVAPGTYRSADKKVTIVVQGKKERRWITRVSARPSQQCQGSRIEFGDRIPLPVSNRVDLWTEGSGDGYVWDQNVRIRFAGDTARGLVVQDADLLAGCTTQLRFSARRR